MLSVDNFGSGLETLPCRSLKVLKVSFVSGNLDLRLRFQSLLASQTQLEELELKRISSHGDTMDAVAEYCAGLKKLTIDRIDLRHAESIERMLKVTGKTLISLRLWRLDTSGDPDTAQTLFDIKSIFRLCPHVTELVAGHLHPWREALL